ncbi:MAG: oligosaccharide flippase family protein [Novosphingobium sp.]
MSEDPAKDDIAALAKGGRTNILGFVIRLFARIPFLIIASRFYGAEAMGRFASALVMVEFAALLCTLGQKRGLAKRLTEDAQHPANAVADAMLLNVLVGTVATVLIYLFPVSMYPNSDFSLSEHLLVLAILPLGLTDIALAALAYRFDVGASVRARAIAEPWALSIAAGALYFVDAEGGLPVAYVISLFVAWLVAMVPLVRSYGLPAQWRPRPVHMWQLTRANMPLAVADLVEWGTRKLDVFLLRFFVGEATLGVYYFAQQFASLPQKLKTSFEPVLGPVITRNVRERNYAAIAKQVCQVGFWITAAQAGIALALGIPGEGLMGLGGPGFVSGTAALIFLLLAEVVAAKAVVSEAALVYLASYKNLVISVTTIALQGALTIGGVLLARELGYSQAYQAAAAAGALTLSLAVASSIKARLLSRILGHGINNWRWPLAWAAGAAVAVGGLATHFLPEWAELAFGIPAILVVYCGVIWKRGFGPEDRVLFRKNVAA